MWNSRKQLSVHSLFLKIIFQKSKATFKSATLLLRQLSQGNRVREVRIQILYHFFFHSVDEINMDSVFLLLHFRQARSCISRTRSLERSRYKNMMDMIFIMPLKFTLCPYRLNQSPLHSIEAFPLTLRGFGSSLIGAGNYITLKMHFREFPCQV